MEDGLRILNIPHNGILNLTRLKIILFFMPDGLPHHIQLQALLPGQSLPERQQQIMVWIIRHSLQSLNGYSLPESVVITVANKSLLKEKAIHMIQQREIL